MSHKESFKPMNKKIPLGTKAISTSLPRASPTAVGSQPRKEGGAAPSGFPLLPFQAQGYRSSAAPLLLCEGLG